MLCTNEDSRTVLSEENWLKERHTLGHVVIGASNPPVETPSDYDVIDQIVGHSLEAVEDRQYEVRWLGLTREEDTYHDAMGLP